MSVVFSIPAEIKNKIITTYAKEKGNPLELETRFGRLEGKKFIPGVTRQIYNRVKDYFSVRSEGKQEQTTDYIMGQVRKTVLPDGEIIWITKERIWNEENIDFGLRFSMSREIPVPPVSIDSFIPDTVREKNRTTYLVFNNTVKIDLTIVNMINSKEKEFVDSTTKYEIEIELLDVGKLNNFEKTLAVTLSLVLDTILLYTEKEKISIIADVNTILRSNKKGFLDNYFLVQARNLKLRDLVYGGLIGNKKTGYNVTFKADGLRKLLYFSKKGVYLLSPPNSLTKISDKEILELSGTIIDGELIPIDKRLKDESGKYSVTAKLWFLAFDCLAWNNDVSVQNLSHSQRMLYCQTVADNCKGDLLLVNTKLFRSFETPNQFFTIMREMLTQRLFLSYKQDGFMFTPQNTVYNPHSDSLPLKKRILTEIPDICKWKPKEELTIDFSVKWHINDDGTRNIYLYVNNKGQQVHFPENYEVDSSHPLTLNIPNDTIVEYAYNYDNKLLIPVRIRHDKILPNKMDVARDIWADIRDPIDEETLKGNTFTLIRKYHNRIKRDLISLAVDSIKSESKNNSDSKNLTLLDIGSGYGGDLNKWKNFHKIIAVEPNPDHVEELRKRIMSQNMQNKVHVVMAKGQDSQIIREEVEKFLGKGERVDVISTMLSLTFFWQSEDLVKSLIDTILTNIKPNGKYIFLTMDGDLVKQTFQPAFGTGLILDKLKLGPAMLEYFSEENMLKINIENSIVKNQTEWLVNISDLHKFLGKYDFISTLQQKADLEKFLTPEEIIMTQMYTFGMFSRKEDSIIPLPENKDKKNKPSETSDIHTVTNYFPINQLKEERTIKTELPELPKQSKIKQSKIELPELPEQSKIELPELPELSKQSKIELPELPELSKQSKIELPKLPELPELSKIDLTKNKVRNGTKRRKNALTKLENNKTSELNIKWWNEKIVRIGSIEENNFLHALLNGFLFEYQKSEDIIFKENLVKDLLKDLKHKNIDTFSKIANNIGIDFFIINLDGPIDNNSQDKRTVVLINISDKNEPYYETIGVERNGIYQTYFRPNDPFILKLKEL